MSDSMQLIEWDRPRGASAMSKTSLCDYLLAHSATIENAMGETARRLMKVTDIVDSIVAASLVDTKLLECSPVSLIYAAVLAARTGLRIGEPFREAYVSVGFNNDLKMPWALFRPMAAGLKAIAFRSGKVAMIEWGAVRAADEFSFRLGDDSFISHSPARRTAPYGQASADERRVWAERTRLTEAYAIIHFLSGHRQFVVLDREQVWRHRKRSKCHYLPNSPWNTDEPAMWEKSAFIELFKRLEFDTEMAAAVAALNDEETGTARLAPALLPEVEIPPPVSPYTDEARPQHDPEADVRSRVAARAARAKKKAAAAHTSGDAPQSVPQAAPQAAPDSLAVNTAAIRERMELRGIRDAEATVLLSWLGVAAVADIAATGLQRALAVTDLKWLVRETGADIRAACQYFGAGEVAELTDAQVSACIRKLAPALLPEVEIPLPVSPYTDEARPQHDPEADVRSRVAARAARAKKKAAAADPNGDAPQSVPQAAPDSQAAHATAIRERMELRGIRDDEATVLLSWLGVEAVADIAAAGLQRALAVTDLKWLVRETGADIEAACQYFGAGEVAELTDAQVSACIRKLEREREVA